MMLVSMETARDVATQLMETAPSVSYNFLHRAGILMGDSAISSNINYDDYLGDWKSIVKKLKESHPIVAGLSDILLLALHKTFKNPAGPTEALKQVEERACANNVAVNFYNFVNVGVPRDVFDDPILGRKYVRVIEGPANGRRSLPSCKSRLEFHGFSMASRSLLTKPLSRRKIQGKGTTKGNVKDDANYDDGTQIEQKWLKGKPRKESRVRVTRRTIDVSMAGNAPDVHLREFCLETAKTGVAKLVKDFNETRAASLKTPISRTAFDHNMDKNRYKDVVCGDEGRVVLTWPPGHPNDYIHANWVPVNGEKRYICTQGPTTKTVEDFWRLVWQEKSKGIVMLCGVMEMGKKKCEQYWPLKQGEQMISGLLTIRNMKVHEYEKMLISSALELSWQGETHRVEHIIWNGWPDRGVPDNYLACLRLIRKMAPLAPVIVHCSAGIGRTGTIVGLDMCQVNLHNGEPINMADIVRELRVHRHGSVQTDVQYIYMHRVLFSLAENKKAIREPEGASFLAEFQAFIKMKGG
ncbi:hypothetical protein QR680_008710 [Steinernema hermaphroditum]|uniref:Tyrosine-protein phosphatase domain-containing protein n=1 Tax=Steinernema hermaphroditum TaxID=289476 RepID=A0AA39M8J4_9BILA|nr:hypothetical protein QR680_008710 [Steinernema hermaphroditum]